MSPATEYRIIYTDVFTETDFHYEIMPGERKYNATTSHMIEEAWHNARLKPGNIIYNGPVVSLLSCAMIAHHETGRNLLYLKVQATDYKSYFGTNVSNPNSLPKSELANAMGACAVVETTDGTVFVGKRSEVLAETRGIWHVPGGTLREAVNPIAGMKNELAAELNISEADIGSAVCLGFGENLLLKKPEFLCYFHINLSELEMSAKMAEAEDRYKHDDFVFVPMEELNDFIDIHPFVPIGKAAVSLYLDFIRA